MREAHTLVRHIVKVIFHVEIHDRQTGRHHLKRNARGVRRADAESHLALIVKGIAFFKRDDAEVLVFKPDISLDIRAVEIDFHIRAQELHNAERLDTEHAAAARLIRLIDKADGVFLLCLRQRAVDAPVGAEIEIAGRRAVLRLHLVRKPTAYGDRL